MALPPSLRSPPALSHLKKGVSLKAAGRLPKAVAEHEQPVALDPKLVQAHVNLISLYGRLGQVDKAEQHYHAAVALDPNRAASRTRGGGANSGGHPALGAGTILDATITSIEDIILINSSLVAASVSGQYYKCIREICLTLCFTPVYRSPISILGYV